VVPVVKCSTTHQFTVIYEVLKSVVLKIQVVWNVMLCCWKGLGLLVNVKTLQSFKVLGTTHPAAQHHILGDLDHLHIFYCAHAQHTAVTVALHAHFNQYDGHISSVPHMMCWFKLPCLSWNLTFIVHIEGNL